MVQLLRQNPLITYLKKLQALFIEVTLLVLCTAISGIIAFYMFDMLWHLYLETQVGQHFIVTRLNETAAIRELLSVNYVYFVAELTLTSFMICLIIAVVSRFSHISRHFYLSMGMPAKLLFWGVPLSGVVGYYMQQEYDFDCMEIIVFVSAFPTLIMFMGCFKVCNQLIPEAGPLISKAGVGVKKMLKDLWEMDQN